MRDSDPSPSARPNALERASQSDETASTLAAASDESAVAAGYGPVREWIINHDESWLFTLTYVGLAVVLSIWISLFWLVVVVAMHFLLEWIRQSHFSTEPGEVFLRSVWELKLDIALVLFALALTAYMEVVLGVAGLGGAARLGLQGGARFAGWSRVLKGVLLSLDDAAQIGRAVLMRSSSQSDEDVPPVTESPWRRRWSVGDHIAIWLGAACLLLLAAAPALTLHTYPSLWAALLAELHPLPPDA
jgi:hypothetical protein